MADEIEEAAPSAVRNLRPVLLGVCWLVAAVLVAVGVTFVYEIGTGLIVGGATLAVLAWLTFGDI